MPSNQEAFSAALDLFARRLDDLREKLASRALESEFNAANEPYKVPRSLKVAPASLPPFGRSISAAPFLDKAKTCIEDGVSHFSLQANT